MLIHTPPAPYTVPVFSCYPSTKANHLNLSSAKLSRSFQGRDTTHLVESTHSLCHLLTPYTLILTARYHKSPHIALVIDSLAITLPRLEPAFTAMDSCERLKEWMSSGAVNVDASVVSSLGESPFASFLSKNVTRKT